MGSPLHGRAGVLLVVATLLAVAVTATSAAVASAESHSPSTGEPRIVELYPDTLEPRDAGEYVAVEFPRPTDTTGWTLEDRYHVTGLPNATLEGTVYFGAEGAPCNHSLGDVALANDGDRVVLRSPTDRIDSVAYGEAAEDAPSPGEGELLERTDDGWRVRHVDAQYFDYRVHEARSAEVYVTPDSGAAFDALESADEAVRLAGFSFTSPETASALEALLSSGGRVEMLLEGGPPGGFPNRSAGVLDELAAAGAAVDVYRGGGRPYRYVHAKYAVVDGDVAVVSSQNWDDAAVADGGDGTRGWGVVVEDEGVARHLTRIFEADQDVGAATPWRETEFDVHEKSGFGSETPATAHGSERHADVEVGVYTAPDVAVEQTTRLLREADDRVYVQQAYVRNWSDGGNPFVDELVAAARRGVEVKLQMDGRWYVEEENREVADRLNRMAEHENLSLEARLSSFAVHNKGLVVDGERAVVSSVNWNENSPTENREVGVVIEDTDAAGYFEEVFLEDWRAGSEDDESRRVPASDLLLEAAVAALASGAGVWLVYRRTSK